MRKSALNPKAPRSSHPLHETKMSLSLYVARCTPPQDDDRSAPNTRPRRRRAWRSARNRRFRLGTFWYTMLNTVPCSRFTYGHPQSNAKPLSLRLSIPFRDIRVKNRPSCGLNHKTSSKSGSLHSSRPIANFLN